MSESKKESHPVDPSKVDKNHVMAFVYYARVDSNTNTTYGAHLHVTNLDTEVPFQVIGDELVVKSYSADYFIKEIKISKTEAAEILTTNYNRPMTVHFIKQDGEPRTLRGRLVSSENLLGRSHMEDLDLPITNKSSRLRLVDHRTIVWLVTEGVKYIVK